VTDGLGEVLLADRISLKLYPCRRNLHALLDAVLRARGHHVGRAIARIEAGTHAGTARWPTHAVEAQFSVPFVMALATITGKPTLRISLLHKGLIRPFAPWATR
jgi:2-methylcitrate dehydratase PrpD